MEDEKDEQAYSAEDPSVSSEDSDDDGEEDEDFNSHDEELSCDNVESGDDRSVVFTGGGSKKSANVAALVREGVQFMFECVSGLQSAANIFGCILADDMGLGKTLQSITLLYTLLRQGFDGKPMVKKAIIVTPTSLVSNWESEIGKWVGERVRLLALCESSRNDVIAGIKCFVSPLSTLQVLIVSYETFRIHSSNFSQTGSCDLLICDEAHRLKNDQTIINKALAALFCKRRILLSGTPMQNDLQEFYAMVNFTNPGILGDIAHFRRYYEFILRRTNALLSDHLPPKIVEVVCCKLSPLQTQLYIHFIQSKNVERVLTGKTQQSKILEYIMALKKLCNHPKLIYDAVRSRNSGNSCFEDCMCLFPPDMFSPRSGAWTGGDGIWVELSGKMQVLARLLMHLRQKTDDRIVLVSNYTQTLDLFAQLCRERRYPFLRLDGSTSISKRQKLVNAFNDPSKDEFVFLLSSKAGGCGLNLIGGNRLVLFDPDWNPANDKQAAARVWRDGQKKRVYIYRFLSTGTIEEKVYQRQMSKEGLQKVIQQDQMDSTKGNFFSMEDLNDLFTFHENVRSEIHEKMNCIRCRNNVLLGDFHAPVEQFEALATTGNCQSEQEDIVTGGSAEVGGCLDRLGSSERQVGSPLEEDLGNWGHHLTPRSVPDAIFQASAGDEVTFVFTNQVHGKLVPVESVATRMHANELEKKEVQSMENKKQNALLPCGRYASRSTLASFPVSACMETMKPSMAPAPLRDATNFSLTRKLSISSKLPMKRSASHSWKHDNRN
ncbi:DNA-dependent ATPase protein rad54 [Dionaea muscipula]